jgi:hypothetical protein
VDQVLGFGLVPAKKKSPTEEPVRMDFHHFLQSGRVFVPEETAKSGVVFDHGPFYYLSNTSGQKGSISSPRIQGLR